MVNLQNKIGKFGKKVSKVRKNWYKVNQKQKTRKILTEVGRKSINSVESQ